MLARNGRVRQSMIIIYHITGHMPLVATIRARGRPEPVCVVIDAIGEWDTCSIWYKKKKVWSKKYPYSLGLFYSAITQYIGLKPNEDEYITMGMAAFGKHVFDLDYLLKYNLHKGIKEYVVGTNEDIAASGSGMYRKRNYCYYDKSTQIL